MPLRFHLDESVHLAVAEGLRRRGIDVTTPRDADLLGAPDDAHLAFAHTNARVVVTHDADFLQLAGRGVSHSGIAFCHNQSRSIGQMIRALELLWMTDDAEGFQARVEFI